MCNQETAPESHADSKVCGQPKKVGSISKTKCGFQSAWANITGPLLNEKLARYAKRLHPRGSRGTHKGQRNISRTPPPVAGDHRSLLKRQEEYSSNTFQVG